MGAGASHEAGDAAAEDKCFYTRTDSLDVWLHQERFRYQLHAIQRPYEWRKTQVVGLLETVANVAKEANTHHDDAVVKLSEVVLLQNVEGRRKQAHLESLQSSDWHKGGIDGARTVQIIDGQQRITTLVLIAAVSQHVLRDLAGKMTDEHAEQRKLANEAVLHLHERFSFTVDEDASGRKGLLWRPGQSGGLADGMFNFDADEADVSVFDDDLARLLQAESLDARTYQKQPHKANAIHIYKWLTDQLKRAGAGAARRGKAGAAAADDAAAASAYAAKQAKWLLGYLKAFRTRVLWTTTLTTSWRLALQTFLSVNLASHRVPLKVMDVIKVTLVSDFNKDRKLSNTLSIWDKCIEQLKSCAATVANRAAPSQFPYLLFLGSGSSLQGIRTDTGAVSDAVIHDCLCHVRAIEKCVASIRANQGAGSSPPVNLANLDGTGADLAQHFAEQRANDKDQAAYLRDNLLPYVQAYCTMLSWQVQSTTGTHELRPQTRVSLIALLSLPASVPANRQASQEANAQGSEPDKAECTWRPAAVAIIRELARNNGLVEMDSPRQKLLGDALKQLECAALTIAVSRIAPATRSAIYERIIQKVSQAGNSSDDNELTNLLANNGLRKLAFEKVPAGSKLKADCARLIEELYCKDAYSLWNGKLAKAVLLSLELDASLSSRRGAGIVQLWEGAMQLEHVLPQNPDPDDDYWPTRFGEVHGNTHRTFVHLLGNLSLIGGKENVDLSNKNFNDKMVKISGEFQLEYNTLQPVLEVWRQGTDSGWDMTAVLARHRWLLGRLADRHGIQIEEGQWVKWRKGLLDKAGQGWQQLLGGGQLLELMHKESANLEEAAAAATEASEASGSRSKRAAQPGIESGEPLKKRRARTAAAAGSNGSGALHGLGAVSLTAANVPASIQGVLDTVAAGTPLQPADAKLLLHELCLHVQEQPSLVSSAPPHKPPVGSVYLFDYLATSNFEDDGHNLKERRHTMTFPEEEVQRITQIEDERESRLKRCVWRIQQKKAGEGDSDLSEQLKACSRYRLVVYVRARKERQLTTAAEQPGPSGGAAAVPPAPPGAPAAASEGALQLPQFAVPLNVRARQLYPDCAALLNILDAADRGQLTARGAYTLFKEMQAWDLPVCQAAPPKPAANSLYLLDISTDLIADGYSWMDGTTATFPVPDMPAGGLECRTEQLEGSECMQRCTYTINQGTDFDSGNHLQAALRCKLVYYRHIPGNWKADSW